MDLHPAPLTIRTYFTNKWFDNFIFFKFISFKFEALNVQVPRKPKGRRNILKLAKKKQESNQPILVDGLPLPTLAVAEEPSGNGYNPIAQVVKLGHKPIASAWRRSSYVLNLFFQIFL